MSTALKSKGTTYSPCRIFVYVPNLIGYVRVIATLLSFCTARRHPLLFLFFYITSFVLDAADGIAARALNQCTHFGSILDMLIDRASTAGMLVVLTGVVQPMPHVFTLTLATFLFVDVGSHFCRMYASVFARQESHKDVSNSIFWLLRLYYSNRKMMGVLCMGQEFFYLLIYAFHFYQHVPYVGVVVWYALLACVVPCLLKQIINVQQLIDALYHIACRDAMAYQE